MFDRKESKSEIEKLLAKHKHSIHTTASRIEAKLLC